jgi:hypothetical protein
MASAAGRNSLYQTEPSNAHNLFTASKEGILENTTWVTARNKYAIFWPALMNWHEAIQTA